MKKQFYFSAMLCVLLSVFVMSVSADYYQPEWNAFKRQDDKKGEAVDKNVLAESARSLMQTIGSVYDQNIKDINKGKRLTLGSVFQGAATVTVAYFSGGSTLSASVPSSISTAVRALGLAGSINASSGLESAYESAISALSSRIWDTSAAIARYSSAWTAYSLVVSGHNSSNHGGPYTYGSAHTISKYQPPSLNASLPSFACPGGGCSYRWTMPSDAREAHYARCGTSDDPYNRWLKGCYKVYYTCNSSDNARHKPQTCGLSKWIQTTHGWTETACPGDYRKCTQTQMQRPHSTFFTGVNVTSTCGGSRPSAPLYHACGVHETSVSGSHSQGTYTCGQHYGYKCQESSDHKTYISSCSETKDGKSCTNTSGYYECSPHSHSYPSSRSSSRNTATCSAGHTYNPNNTYSVNLHRDRTCRFSGCGNSWQACSISGWSPYCENAYRKSKGWKCGAQ